jgi:hypothetical protein
MQVEDQMTIADGVCTFRPLGKVSLVESVEMITSVIVRCRARNITKLLVDMTELFGIRSPLADASDGPGLGAGRAGKLVIAVVALPEYIDPKKFGVQAAGDAGLKATFTSVADAVASPQANEPS